tara:strand:- start:225 stop:638 length:414 start_codon:yes stop_codon:yes gene_type:complete
MKELLELLKGFKEGDFPEEIRVIKKGDRPLDRGLCCLVDIIDYTLPLGIVFYNLKRYGLVDDVNYPVAAPKEFTKLAEVNGEGHMSEILVFDLVAYDRCDGFLSIIPKEELDSFKAEYRESRLKLLDMVIDHLETHC